MFCFNCGTQSNENTKFCGKCGSTIQQKCHQVEPEAAQQPQMMEPPTESTGNQSQMWEQQPQVTEQAPRGKKWLPFVGLGVVALGIVFALGIGIALLVSGDFNASDGAQESPEMAEVVELEPVTEQESVTEVEVDVEPEQESELPELITEIEPVQDPDPPEIIVDDESEQERESPEAVVENPLVGRWVFEDDPSWVTTFNADGSGIHTISWGYGYTFRWSLLQNNTIRWNYAGYPMMVTPFRMSNNALYITVDDGTEYRYIRE